MLWQSSGCHLDVSLPRWPRCTALYTILWTSQQTSISTSHHWEPMATNSDSWYHTHALAVYKTSFFPHDIILWNQLPACVVGANTEDSFKAHQLRNCFRKTFGKFFRSYSELLSKIGDISFQEYLSKGISHPVFYGDLVYKLRRVKDTPNYISSGSKIVKRLRRRQYDPVIIERNIGLVLALLQPCTNLS